MQIKEINVNRFLTKSKILGIDFVINPYVGCPNGCLYCYASFLRPLKKHDELWGEFIDIKTTDNMIKKRSVTGKTILLSSTTDPYNKYEKDYKITRSILVKLVDFDFHLIIETKNKLILRDINLLRKMKDVKVIISLNTLNDNFRRQIENYSTIDSRIKTLKTLHEEGIYTILNISPIFPFITDYKEIIDATKDYVLEYQFSFLTLKNDYKREILKFIKEHYEKYYLEYAKIYLLNDHTYFHNLKIEILNYCKENKIKYTFN